MHRNLTSVQKNMAENVGEILGILDISDKRPVILSALGCAEKPLSEKEVTQRTGIGRKTVSLCLDRLKEIGVVVAAESDRDVTYELTADMEKVILGNMRAKIDAIRAMVKRHVGECETLLESAREEYDDYDRLMARYLRERVSKMKFLSTVMTKRSALLRLLDSGEEGNAEITKIPIE
jgi:DNA-binding transcriptional regulator GbsR (MarR family)